jgi:hypothetical protein
MTALKYDKYFLYDLKLPEEHQKKLAKYSRRATRVLWLDEHSMAGTPMSFIFSWYWKATTEDETIPAHFHDWDEILGFFGSDKDNPYDLGGEVELWMGDEKYLITRSCLILAPKNLSHCPLRVTRVDRPFIFQAVSASRNYYKLFEDQAKAKEWKARSSSLGKS